MEPMNTSSHFLSGGVAPLSPLGIIQIQGDDAVSFIHGQLTQDFVLLDLQQARLAAFCNPKGRMLASFIGFKRSPTEVFLVCSKDLLAQTAKRLAMFVMRAKAVVRDVSESWAVYGLLGNAVLDPAAQAGAAPASPMAVAPLWSCAQHGAATVVTLAPVGQVPRQLWIGPHGTAPSGAVLDEAVWQWTEVQSGIATLSRSVVELFVPQMLNYESVGGVSFKKGCYPGQEVVARSQFRGTLKRRAFIAHSSHAMAAGDAVWLPDDPEQPVGTVVQAAPHPEGGFDAIVSLQLVAAQAPALRVQQAGGAVLHLQAVPYPLLEDL